MSPNNFTTSFCLTEQNASICAEQELDNYIHPYYYGIEEVALDGDELVLGSSGAPKATRVDYFSSPYQSSWPPAKVDVESSRVRKKQFRDTGWVKLNVDGSFVEHTGRQVQE